MIPPSFSLTLSPPPPPPIVSPHLINLVTWLSTRTHKRKNDYISDVFLHLSHFSHKAMDLCMHVKMRLCVWSIVI